MTTEFEQQLNADTGVWNGGYWKREYREDGSLMATFSVAGRRAVVRADAVYLITHDDQVDASFTGSFDGHEFVKGVAPLPPGIVDDRTKRERLAALRAKGWASLTVIEQAEANALRFDLGQ